MCQNPEDVRILAHLSDFQNSTFKDLYRPCKVFLFYCFSVRCCADQCESTLAGKVVALCMACKGT
jgi:hypothetical protein